MLVVVLSVSEDNTRDSCVIERRQGSSVFVVALPHLENGVSKVSQAAPTYLLSNTEQRQGR